MSEFCSKAQQDYFKNLLEKVIKETSSFPTSSFDFYRKAMKLFPDEVRQNTMSSFQSALSRKIKNKSCTLWNNLNSSYKGVVLENKSQNIPNELYRTEEDDEFIESVRIFLNLEKEPTEDDIDKKINLINKQISDRENAISILKRAKDSIKKKVDPVIHLYENLYKEGNIANRFNEFSNCRNFVNFCIDYNVSTNLIKKFLEKKLYRNITFRIFIEAHNEIDD